MHKIILKYLPINFRILISGYIFLWAIYLYSVIIYLFSLNSKPTLMETIASSFLAAKRWGAYSLPDTSFSGICWGGVSGLLSDVMNTDTAHLLLSPVPAGMAFIHRRQHSRSNSRSVGCFDAPHIESLITVHKLNTFKAFK